jgi:hypothetical protein
VGIAIAVSYGWIAGQLVTEHSFGSLELSLIAARSSLGEDCGFAWLGFVRNGTQGILSLRNRIVLIEVILDILATTPKLHNGFRMPSCTQVGPILPRVLRHYRLQNNPIGPLPSVYLSHCKSSPSLFARQEATSPSAARLKVMAKVRHPDILK